MLQRLPRELDAYRERVDRFIADLDQEDYDHFAGLKEDFDLESIYGATRTSRASRRRGACAAVDGGFSSIELCGSRARAISARSREARGGGGEAEAKLKTTVDGEEIPFRMLRPAIANSDDRDRRERIERVRNERPRST